MKFINTDISGAYIICQEPFSDNRGYFTRVFCEKEFLEIGINMKFVQSNLCYNSKKGTLRGLHLQTGSDAEDKLVMCTRGKVYDVCVDVRKTSLTFGKHIAIELSEENGNMILIPKGCAHGYLTLEDNCQLLYMMSEYYIPGKKAGYRYDDPFFSIEWPLSEPYIISDEDRLFKNIRMENYQ